jgi:hypothetical protein
VAAEPVSSTGFLPFLDLLFGTIGVFLTVLALERLVAEQERALPLPDAILICLPDGGLAWHDRFAGLAPAGDLDDLGDWLRKAGAGGAAVLRVLVAFGPQALGTERRLAGRLQEFLEIDARPAPPTAAGQDLPPTFQYVLWPLPSDDPFGTQLVERWREELAGE